MPNFKYCQQESPINYFNEIQLSCWNTENEVSISSLINNIFNVLVNTFLYKLIKKSCLLHSMCLLRNIRVTPTIRLVCGRLTLFEINPIYIPTIITFLISKTMARRYISLEGVIK